MRHRRGSASRESVGTAIARAAPSIALTEAAELPPEGTPLATCGNNAEAGQDDARRWSQKWDADDDEDEDRDKRKNVMDIEERRRQLEADAWATEVEAKRVKCRGCTRWIKLDQRSLYYRGLWDKHRDLCRGIKRLKGEHIPKRTRRSKTTGSAAKRKKGTVSAYGSASGTAASVDSDANETPPCSESSGNSTQTITSSDHGGGECSPAPDNKRPTRTRRLHAFPRALVTHTQAASPSRAARPNDRSPYLSSTAHRTPASATSDGTSHRFAAAPSQVVTWIPGMERAYPAGRAHHTPWSSWDANDGRPRGEPTRGRSASYPCQERTQEDYDNEDRDAGVFAPDIPSKCPSIPCHPRFRFSTQRELDTYFDGTTISGMATKFIPIEPYGAVHSVECLARLGKGKQPA
ncbi:hypothetical protein LshimejAT787_1800490 [Lyophyllum shimeji]|uniref:Uncharacterized protein n=1 Tax=Lyophyllum shimeji TaxID=47721 RepID=A0A9P3UU07_LYOSH|nr:hypothetical protein LshimejAT787_1800490 [Lyophyllum shimeji]